MPKREQILLTPACPLKTTSLAYSAKCHLGGRKSLSTFLKDLSPPPSCRSDSLVTQSSAPAAFPWKPSLSEIQPDLSLKTASSNWKASWD